MKTKVSPAIVGLFVLGALLLGLVALFSFGGVNFFSKPQRFLVNFDESVHGLDLGSAVKLRGVRVGRVVQMNLSYQPETNRSVVSVLCELTRNVIVDGEGRDIDVSSRDQLQSMVDRGLRARLNVQGLATGLLYVELDFRNPAVYPPAPPAGRSVRHVEVPAIRSAISEFESNITDILGNLKEADFAGLTREARGVLADTRVQINATNVAALVDSWRRAADSIEGVMGSPELKEAIASINTSSAKLNRLLDNLDGRVGPASDELLATLAETRQTVAAFRSGADSLKRFINAQQHLGDDASRALERLGEASAAIARLADFLERNPGAILSGRADPDRDAGTPAAPADDYEPLPRRVQP